MIDQEIGKANDSDNNSNDNLIIKKTVKLRNNNERIYLYIHTYTSNYCKLISEEIIKKHS